MRFMHCGWEPDESDDTYARPGEQKSIITIYVADEDGHPDDEVACIVHRHIGDMVDTPTTAAKERIADRIVEALNRGTPGGDLAALTGLPLNEPQFVESWTCECGCVFLPDWVGGDGVYPDRYMYASSDPDDPGDGHDCECHRIPREIPREAPAPPSLRLEADGDCVVASCETCSWGTAFQQDLDQGETAAEFAVSAATIALRQFEGHHHGPGPAETMRAAAGETRIRPCPHAADDPDLTAAGVRWDLNMVDFYGGEVTVGEYATRAEAEAAGARFDPDPHWSDYLKPRRP